MTKQTLVDGYQPNRPAGPPKEGRSGPDTGPGPFHTRPPSGPTPSEKLPKTTSSVIVPKK